MNESYVQRMFVDVNDLFDKINKTIASNRDEIKDLSYRTESELK